MGLLSTGGVGVQGGLVRGMGGLVRGTDGTGVHYWNRVGLWDCGTGDWDGGMGYRGIGYWWDWGTGYGDGGTGDRDGMVWYGGTGGYGTGSRLRAGVEDVDGGSSRGGWGDLDITHVV